MTLLLAASLDVAHVSGVAQTPSKANSRPPAGLPPERAVRRDLPLTKTIRRAMAAQTRDSSGTPGPKYWQLWTEYSIEAQLDPTSSTITGRERVVIHNRGDSALSEIVLRLDQNLLRPDVPRAVSVPEPTDGMQVTGLAANGQPLDLATLYLRATVVAIQLPVAIAPGGRGTLDVEWHFRIPRESPGRMGRWDDTLYQVAQWYPRVAVFDDLRGWDREHYLGGAEFYNNYGRFDVRLDVPAGWLVGATGALQNPEAVLTPTARERLTRVLESDSVRSIVSASEVGPGQATVAGDRLVWHFVADTVTDFAWATSSRYVWDATRATIPGKGAIPIHVLYLPGHAQDYARAGAVSRHAVEFYSRILMPYAYLQLTMVEGPEGGMEYPMLVMSSVFAADHEIGHQWWPMTVGSNETWYAFMDEGLTVYMNMLSEAAAEGQRPGLDSLGLAYGQRSGDEREAPLMWNANYAGPGYLFQAYGKAPQMLSMLGGIVGDSAVLYALSEYAKAWRFRHPSPWDFAFFMNRTLGQDFGWFWYYWLFTTESVDGSIQQVITRDRRTFVTVRQDGQMPSPVVLRVKLARQGPPIRRMPNSTLPDSVTAVVTYPVDVWFSGRRTFVAELDFGGRRIEQVTLDPARRFPDRDPMDNVWPRPEPTARH